VRQRIAGAQTIGDDRRGDAGPRDDELAECALWIDIDLARLTGLARPREQARGKALGVALDALERGREE